MFPSYVGNDPSVNNVCFCFPFPFFPFPCPPAAPCTEPASPPVSDSEVPACHAATEGPAEVPNIFFNDEFPPTDGFCLGADDERSSGNWAEVSLGGCCDFFEEFEV